MKWIASSCKLEQQFFQTERQTNCLDIILACNAICVTISALPKDERRLFQLWP